MRIFQMLDNIGPVPRLNHLGKYRYTTIFCGLVNILTFCVSVILQRKVLIDAIYNTNPDYYLNESPFYNQGIVSSNLTKLYIAFEYFASDMIAFLPIPRAMIPKVDIYEVTNVDGLLYEWKYYDSFSFCNDSNGNVFENFNAESDMGRGNYSQEFIEEVKQRSICLPTNFNVSVNVDAFNLGSKTYYFVIPYPSLRKMKDKYNTTIQLRINYQEILLDKSNKSPFKLYWKFAPFTIDMDRGRLNNLLIEQFSASIDNTKFLIPEVTNHGYNIVRSIEKVYDFERFTKLDSKPEVYQKVMNANYWFGLVANKSQSSGVLRYASYTDFLARLGGFFAIMRPVTAIVAILVEPFYQASKINNIFSFHENSYDPNNQIIMDYMNEFYNHKSSPSSPISQNYVYRRKSTLAQAHNTSPTKVIEDFKSLRSDRKSFKSIELKHLNESDARLAQSNHLSAISHGQQEGVLSEKHIEPSIKIEMIAATDRKKRFLLSLQEKRKSRRVKKISPFYFKCLKWRSNLPKEKLFKDINLLLTEALCECNMTKRLIEFRLLKKLMINDYHRDYYVIPSINLSDTSTIDVPFLTYDNKMKNYDEKPGTADVGFEGFLSKCKESDNMDEIILRNYISSII